MLDMLADANIGWGRTEVWWIHDEPFSAADFAANADTGDISRVAATVHWAKQRGMDVYVGLAVRAAPSWANGGFEGNLRGPACDFFDDYEAWVQRVVDKFDSLGVTHYSVGNEPNTPTHFYQNCFGDNWITDYERMLKIVARVVHAKRPGINKVIGYEAAHVAPLQDQIDVVTQSLARLDATPDATDAPDIIAVHVYGNASLVRGDVEQWASQVYPREVWLTEVGTAQSLPPERDQRDHLARVLSDFNFHRQWSNWTKVFSYALAAGDYQFFLGAQDDNPATLAPREAYWAYKYIARSWAGATTGISYGAFDYTTYQWFYGADASDTPPVNWEEHYGPGLWGASFSLDESLFKAGMRLCAQFHLGFIGWLPNNNDWYCGENPFAGPIEYGGQNHQLEAFRVRVENPLPGRWGPMYVCGAAYTRWWGDQQYCENNTLTLGTTGQALPLVGFRLHLGNDVRP